MSAAARAERTARTRARDRGDRLRLLDLLIAAGSPLNLEVIPVADNTAAGDAVLSVVRDHDPEWGGEKGVVAWGHPQIYQLGLDPSLADLGIAYTDAGIADPDAFRRAAARASVGITSAEFAVADTATVVLKTRPGEPRSASLLPSVHVAVITLDQILEDVSELYALLNEDILAGGDGIGRCTTFISGPSKTADIELVMVHGAHGPRAMTIVVITG
jgi:L-lactate dehydrogenase complex protein LldG